MTSTLLTNSPITLGDITFNAVEDTTGVEWYADPPEGWGSPAPTLKITQHPRSHGGFASESFLQSRVLAISGSVYAPSAEILSDALDRLLSAVSLSDTTFSVSEFGRVRYCTVQRQDAPIVNLINEYVATFSLQLVAKDPRKYGDLITASTGLPSTSGGLTLPFTGPFTIGATVTSGVIGIDNPGNIASPVTIRIDGPCTGPILSHVGQGRFLEFASSYDLASGNWLDIDLSARTVLENGQASRFGYVTERGFFDFDPGPNTIGFNAAVYNSSALATVTVRPAYQ